VCLSPQQICHPHQPEEIAEGSHSAVRDSGMTENPGTATCGAKSEAHPQKELAGCRHTHHGPAHMSSNIITQSLSSTRQKLIKTLFIGFSTFLTTQNKMFTATNQMCCMLSGVLTTKLKKLNSVALVRKRTIPTKRLPLSAK
jgi:hypothetical protein